MWAAQRMLGGLLLVPTPGGPLEWGFILLILLLFFGAGRVTTLGRDLGRSIRAFRRGLQGEEEKPSEEDKGGG